MKNIKAGLKKKYINAKPTPKTVKIGTTENKEFWESNSIASSLFYDIIYKNKYKGVYLYERKQCKH